MTATLHAVSTCHQCGKTDDHPKFHVGHFDDARLDWSGHHDCLPHARKLETFAGSHSQHPLIIAKIIDACEKGTKGEELRALIGELHMRDFGDAQMASGIDQTMANAIVAALTPTSGTTTIGTVTVTGPVKCRFDSAMGTDSTAATEFSGGSYPAGGISIGTNWAAVSGGARATNAAVTTTGSPATNWAGNEIWDVSGTPLRSFWGALAGGTKVVNLGDTCQIGSGQLTVSLA
jgi:hypothetical protein